MKLLNEAFKHLKVNKLHFIIPFLFFLFITLNAKAQPNSDLEDISVLLQIDGVNNTYNIAALYSPEGKLYVSIEELFQVLNIPCIVNKDGNILSGFIENEERLYEINYLTKQIKNDANSYTFHNELIKNIGMIYLESSMFEKTFGLHLNFNFRSLSIKITSDFELPLIKKQRLEKTRNTIQKNSGVLIVDETVKRDYHLFRYGMLDWSAMSSQTKNKPVDSRFGLNLGAELLFGEANVYLNFSDRNKPDPRQQQYHWRWVDNDKTIIRQIQAGNISNKTISSINAPIHGAIITNTPTSIRKAKGEYTISDVTQPDWFVELYINNALIDYTKADAAGQFTFKVPIVYGYTVLKLKFYGPMGEERTEERIMNVPNNFMPSGVFEYKIGGGLLQDNDERYFGRGEGNYGVTRNFTIGGGVEYLSSINNLTSIPFVSVSILPMRKLTLSGEYAHKVRTKALLNYYLWSNAMFEIDYTKYTEGQKAILYNYLEERKVGLSIPVRLKSVSASTRISFKQNVYKNFTYNMADVMLSAFYRQFNINVSTYANWIDDKSVYINTNAALSVRLPKGFSFRPSAQFNLSNSELISYKTELEKKVSKAGYCSVSYEKNIISNYNSLNISFRYNLSFAQTDASVRVINQDVSLMESARGGIAFDDKNRRIFASQQSMVGRGGIAFIPFVDINQNGTFDIGERKAKGLSVKINGGRAVFNEKDSIIRIMGLEPFIYYNAELDDKDFEFITWRLNKKNYSILVDPNQFKTINIPISPVAEITGTVFFDNDSTKKGLGRVMVNIYKKDGSIAAKTISESDGYLSYLGLLPGEYYAKIDSVQLNRLQMEATPPQVDFTLQALEEGDVYNGVDFVLNHKPTEIVKQDTLAIINDTLIKTDSLLNQNINAETIPELLDTKITDSLTDENINIDTKSKLPNENIITDSLTDENINKVTPELPILEITDSLYKENIGIDTTSNIPDNKITDNLTDENINVDTKSNLTDNKVTKRSISKKGRDKTTQKPRTSKITNNVPNEKISIDTISKLPNENIITDSLTDENRNINTKPSKPPVSSKIIDNKNTKINAENQVEVEKDMLVWGNICTQNGYYVVQCGAFKIKNNAMKLALYIKQTTDLMVGVLFIKDLYKVQVGCTPTMKEAEEIKRKLLEDNVGDYFYIKVAEGTEDTEDTKNSVLRNNHLIKADTEVKDQQKYQNNVIIWGKTCTQIGNYYIEYGTFKSEDNAMKLAMSINQFTNIAVGIVLNNGQYEVHVGCVSTKKEAAKIKKYLDEKLKNENVLELPKFGNDDITTPASKNFTTKDNVENFNEALQTDQNSENTLVWGEICTQTNNFYVQCGAFISKHKAKKLARTINRDTDLTVGVILNNGFFKVQVGCVPNKNEADDIKNQLIEKGVCESVFITIRR